MSSDDCEDVTEGGALLALPGGLSERQVPIGVQCLSKERGEAGEAKEHRRRAVDGAIRPLALSSRCPSGHDLPQRALPGSSASCASLLIGSAAWGESVEKIALGGRWLLGARVKTQRIGTGWEPARDHRAVPVHISRGCSPSP